MNWPLLYHAASAPHVYAYVGPGAGFALLSSFFVLFTTILIIIASTAVWPFRMAWRAMTRQATGPATATRLIIVGFDGQDPKLTDQYIADGRLPNFKKLAAMGCYRRLRTTFPAISPVAWSSFSTGCEPSRHNIFDFIEPDRRTYLPRLSSTRIGRVGRFFRIGRYRIPREKPDIRAMRKSKPFWTILGTHQIWSTILRVPITFPPDRFYGAQLSAMSVPDVLGTQGTFLLFTTRPRVSAPSESGIRIGVRVDQDRVHAEIPGPENIFREGSPPLAIPLRVVLDRAGHRAHANLGGAAVTLVPGQLSEWIRLTFRIAPGLHVRGLSRLLVTEMDDHFSLYMSPINLDPEDPAMPVSHPSFFATYLAKRIGPYATLGIAEDTGALNDGVIDDATFLKQTHDIDDERQRMLFTALARLKRGSLVCVFDATDRIQHMFWRELDQAHPAHPTDPPTGHTAIRDLYERNDALLGRVMKEVRDGDVLMVLSDHGFSSFRRGINVNAWLCREGYLTLKSGASGAAEWLRDIDWSATRAFSLGLAGLFLNVEGREAHGIVAPADAPALKAELIARLTGLRDEERSEIGIREAFDTATLYAGPYRGNAPDILIGYNAGYRTSWECARGVVAGPIFTDNARPWSGDHCIDPRLVPGVFFCNRSTSVEMPALIDIAPTALRLFGIDPPPHMDGRPLAGIA